MLERITQESIDEYATDERAVKEQPVGTDYLLGAQVGKTIPAKHWNWMFGAVTKRAKQVRKDSIDLARELQNAVTDAGLTLDTANDHQLSQAIKIKAENAIEAYKDYKSQTGTQWEDNCFTEPGIPGFSSYDDVDINILDTEDIVVSVDCHNNTIVVLVYKPSTKTLFSMYSTNGTSWQQSDLSIVYYDGLETYLIYKMKLVFFENAWYVNKYKSADGATWTEVPAFPEYPYCTVQRIERVNNIPVAYLNYFDQLASAAYAYIDDVWHKVYDSVGNIVYFNGYYFISNSMGVNRVTNLSDVSDAKFYAFGESPILLTNSNHLVGISNNHGAKLGSGIGGRGSGRVYMHYYDADEDAFVPTTLPDIKGVHICPTDTVYFDQDTGGYIYPVECHVTSSDKFSVMYFMWTGDAKLRNNVCYESEDGIDWYIKQSNCTYNEGVFIKVATNATAQKILSPVVVNFDEYSLLLSQGYIFYKSVSTSNIYLPAVNHKASYNTTSISIPYYNTVVSISAFDANTVYAVDSSNSKLMISTTKAYVPRYTRKLGGKVIGEVINPKYALPRPVFPYSLGNHWFTKASMSVIYEDNHYSFILNMGTTHIPSYDTTGTYGLFVLDRQTNTLRYLVPAVKALVTSLPGEYVIVADYKNVYHSTNPMEDWDTVNLPDSNYAVYALTAFMGNFMFSIRGGDVIYTSDFTQWHNMGVGGYSGTWCKFINTNTRLFIYVYYNEAYAKLYWFTDDLVTVTSVSGVAGLMLTAHVPGLFVGLKYRKIMYSFEGIEWHDTGLDIDWRESPDLLELIKVNNTYIMHTHVTRSATGINVYGIYTSSNGVDWCKASGDTNSIETILSSNGSAVATKVSETPGAPNAFISTPAGVNVVINHKLFVR